MGCSAVEKTVLINGVSASVNELFKKKMSALGSMMLFVGNFRNTSECVTLQQRTVDAEGGREKGAVWLLLLNHSPTEASLS